MDEAEWRGDPVLSIVAKRQYVDWRPFRHAVVDSPSLGQAIERFCTKIVETLRESWLSPEERVRQEAEARRRAEEEERIRQEAEAKRQAKERERLRKEALARKRAEEEARKREEAEARKRAEEEERIRLEAEARRQGEEEERLRKEAQAKKLADEEDAKRSREEAETQRRLAEGAERQRQESEAIGRAEEERRKPDEPTRAEVGARRQAENEVLQLADAGESETQAQSSTPWRPSRRNMAIVGAVVVAMAASAAAWWSQHRLNLTALTAAQERALKAGDSFNEGADCPEMIVVPAGRFTMGSPEGQGNDSERPAHEVTIAKPFAVAKFTLTFDEWDACAAGGGCRSDVSDSGWGRGRRPAINVSWDDAQAYVKWLSRITGKPYRLLSEAEYEYAARAGSETKYPWGDDIKLNGKPMANCDGCGSQWDGNQTAPVGSFPANAFGLYDVVCNVWEWTEDCWNETYRGAPVDGSAWTSGDCSARVVRGGTWHSFPGGLRSANRSGYATGFRYNDLGFRVARTLSP